MKVLLPDWPEARALDDLPAGTEVLWVGDGALPPAAELAGVEFAVIPEMPQSQVAELFRRLGGAAVLQTVTAGVDGFLPHVPPGPVLCDAAGVHDVPVAEWIAGVILATAKRLGDHREAQRLGIWRERDGDDVEGSEVLIVGHGSIGRALEARLAPFDVRIRRVARRARPGVASADALPQLLPSADVVVLLLPNTRATAGFVDATFLARMRPGALLVNAGRGRVVDTGALVDALREGRIRAALDVTDPEPLPPGHPLWSAPNLLLTPHIAGDVPRFPARAMAFAAQQLRRHAAGEPLAERG